MNVRLLCTLAYRAALEEIYELQQIIEKLRAQRPLYPLPHSKMRRAIHRRVLAEGKQIATRELADAVQRVAKLVPLVLELEEAFEKEQEQNLAEFVAGMKQRFSAK